MSNLNSKEEGVKMNTEEIVKKVLTEQNCKDNDIIFLLQCWREQGCRAYFNYTDLFKADSPRKLLELRDLAMKEGDKHSETREECRNKDGMSICNKGYACDACPVNAGSITEISSDTRTKLMKKATPKPKKRAEKEVENKPVGSKIEDD